MYWKPGQAPRRYSLQGLVLRTIAAVILGGVFAALLVSLIRSDGIQQGSGAYKASQMAVDVQILPILDSRPLQSSSDRVASAQQVTTHLLQLAQPTVSKRPAKDSLYSTKEFEQQLLRSAGEPLGKVYRLQSSVEQPLGASGLENPLCVPFSSSTRSVAIVGNGPIMKADRHEIETHDVVIRFNLMNNWQRFREKVTVWVMRHSKEAKAGYWGINNIDDAEAAKILSLLKGVWLVGGNQTHADTLLKNHPVLEWHTPVLMPEAPVNKAFAADLLDSPNSYPSTGFVGLQATLYCTEPSVKLHVYGFNWSRKTWGGHNVNAEREYINKLEAEGRAVVHVTACNGMRECGDGDIDASCHWSTDGHYMCLRGKPRKWKDMTDQIEKSRMQEFRANVSSLKVQ